MDIKALRTSMMILWHKIKMFVEKSFKTIETGFGKT